MRDFLLAGHYGHKLQPCRHTLTARRRTHRAIYGLTQAERNLKFLKTETRSSLPSELSFCSEPVFVPMRSGPQPQGLNEKFNMPFFYQNAESYLATLRKSCLKMSS